MILIIDNYDSFTYNVYQAVASLGFSVKVVPNDEITIDEIQDDQPEKIILSPGPGTPANSGICLAVINKFHQQIPILGICLGHQCLGVAFGARITRAKKLIYGKKDRIRCKRSDLFNDINSPFSAARYNSLVLDREPNDFKIIAVDNNEDIMAIEHDRYPLFGVQFHPESFLTKNGDKMLRNFLTMEYYHGFTETSLS